VNTTTLLTNTAGEKPENGERNTKKATVFFAKEMK